MLAVDIKKIAFGSPEYALSKNFRNALLRVPLGLSLSTEDLAGEDTQHHFAAITQTQEIVGTVILKPISRDIVKIRQMAVSQNVQNNGIGTKLMTKAEQYAQDNGFKSIHMTARVSAKNFYERLGYRTDGEEFMDVIPVPSIKMVKDFT